MTQKLVQDDIFVRIWRTTLWCGVEKPGDMDIHVIITEKRERKPKLSWRMGSGRLTKKNSRPATIVWMITITVRLQYLSQSRKLKLDSPRDTSIISVNPLKLPIQRSYTVQVVFRPTSSRWFNSLPVILIIKGKSSCLSSLSEQQGLSINSWLCANVWAVLSLVSARVPFELTECKLRF